MKAGTLLRVLGVSCILAAAITAAAWARNGVEHRGAPANDPQAHVIIWVTMKINGTEVPGFFRLPTIESGVDPSKLSLNPGKPLKPPKELTPPTLTIARGLDQDLTLSKWHEAALRGDPSAPSDVVVTGFDYQGQPVATWHLQQAWPSHYETGKTGDSVETEIVTIVSEKLERVN